MTSVNPPESGLKGQEGVQVVGNNFGGVLALALGKIMLIFDGEEQTMYPYVLFRYLNLSNFF